MSESKDRAALHAMVDAFGYWPDNSDMSKDALAVCQARTALAQPDPAEKLAQALRQIADAWKPDELNPTLDAGAMSRVAHAALAAYEGK